MRNLLLQEGYDMKYGPEKHHRWSIRLKEYDYSRSGYYFVTICTHNHKFIFGHIENEGMRLNRYGEIIEECWRWLEMQYSYVSLGTFIIMPNHLHGIIIINNDDKRRGGSRTAPTKRKPLGRLIGAFKTVSAKKINAIYKITNSTIWQRNYYEHVIRNENELNKICEYIVFNPLHWETDEENPINWETKP
jgi:putative transposase